MRVRPFAGVGPRFGARVFVASDAVIVGDVELGDDASVWYGAVLRADLERIRIGARSNVQDGVIIHVDSPDLPAILEEEVSVGHGAVLHGCTVRRGALIGMGATVLDGAIVGEGAIVAAGALVPPGTQVPARTMVAGVPAKVIRELNEADTVRTRRAVLSYLEMKGRYLAAEDEREVSDPVEWEKQT